MLPPCMNQNKFLNTAPYILHNNTYKFHNRYLDGTYGYDLDNLCSKNCHNLDYSLFYIRLSNLNCNVHNMLSLYLQHSY